MESTSSAAPGHLSCTADQPVTLGVAKEGAGCLELGLILCTSAISSLIYSDTMIEQPLGIFICCRKSACFRGCL